jgi:hypothetical protein
VYKLLNAIIATTADMFSPEPLAPSMGIVSAVDADDWTVYCCWWYFVLRQYNHA